MKSSLSNLHLTCLSWLSISHDTYDNWRCQNCLNNSQKLFFTSSYPIPRRSRWRWLENPLLHLTLSLSGLKRGIYHIHCTTAGPDAIFFLAHQKEMYPLIPLSLKTPPHFFLVTCRQIWKGAKRACTENKMFHNMNVLQKASPLIAEKWSLTVDMVLGTKWGNFGNGC